ncbi:MAG: DNA helicase [Spartobacteria bacterium]|nr:DNA helicase [Spartobacteria bacterium]
MVATVRNRRGVLSGVQPHDGPTGAMHVVDIEYNDGETPGEERLIWECEPHARLLPPSALPDPSASDPMRREDLLALQRACRWLANRPYVDPDGNGPLDRLPVISPFHGGVEVEDYQLVPLLKALRMPRVSLLIADDVGLGKTIEAGLILSELLLRRRVRRVLIMTPAPLRIQWRDELWSKFSLPFEIVDRPATLHLRRQLGMDANPWRSFSRIVTSYHYLKQPDVLESFLSACRAETSDALLPWDLLIVDEVHNLTPAPFGEESELCRMLRRVAPLFEHRLFLTATPHNGHTRSFSGLLELLDPVRFSQTEEFKPAERARIQDVLVRRLKREINQADTVQRFSERHPPQALLLERDAAEKVLSDAFAVFRERIRALIADGAKRRRLAGAFAVEILGKRLLSCPVAFADSWWRCREGLAQDAADDREVLTACRGLDDDLDDDLETESRTRVASKTIGAWLKPFADELSTEMAALNSALSGLDLGPDALDAPVPCADARFDALIELIETRLWRDGSWREDERLVVFTEYKTTLDYLLQRMREHWCGDENRMLCLYGGMDDTQREDIKAAFNDPAHPVRILLGTDAAAEGLNLQQTARYLLHYDVPWNPARLEQRNGRLDRHGQARDVTVFHFVSPDDQDLAFLDLVVRKVDTIREDLGATAEVFDEITYRRLVEGEDFDHIRADLDRRVAAASGRADTPRDDRTRTVEPEVVHPLDAVAAEIDYNAETVRDTLEAAMAVGVGHPRLSEPETDGCCRILSPHPPSWSAVIDDAVRLSGRGEQQGPLPRLAFDARALLCKIGERRVFRPRADTLLLHLSHPLMQRALSTLSRLRFPGSGSIEVSRWTALHAPVADGAIAELHLTVEELAVNDLRETFHHWVRTVCIPVYDDGLGDALPHRPARMLQQDARKAVADEQLERARDLWIDYAPDVRTRLKGFAEELTVQLREQINMDRQQAVNNENERYQSRQGEISALIENSTLVRLERELDGLRHARQQGLLFDQNRVFDELDRDINLKEDELKRRRQHYGELRDQLARERERILKHLIPARYTMRGNAQVMPVSVEIILPEVSV